jgi:hypothetical protein
MAEPSTPNYELPTYIVDIGIDFSTVEVIDELKRLKCCKDDVCAEVKACIETPDACKEPTKACIAPYDKLNHVFKNSSLSLKTRAATFTTYYKPNTSKLPDEIMPSGFECYNYVIGKSKPAYKDAPYLENTILMRVGKFDDSSFFELIKCYVNSNAKSTASQESICGIKHIQMASIDMEILFSGVLIIDNGNIIITPMSGTFIENVLDSIAKDENMYDQCIECVLLKQKPENLGKLMTQSLEADNCSVYIKTPAKTTDKKTALTRTVYQCEKKKQTNLVNQIELYNFLNIMCTEYALKHLRTSDTKFNEYEFKGKDFGKPCIFTSMYTKAPMWVQKPISNPCLEPYINAGIGKDDRCTQDIPSILNITDREKQVTEKVKQALAEKGHNTSPELALQIFTQFMSEKDEYQQPKKKQKQEPEPV